MGSGAVIAIVVVGIALVAGIAYWSYKREKERKAALAAYAAGHGFQLTERDDSLIQRWGESADPFDEGFDKRCENIMRGVWDGRPATLFDYTYHTWETSTDSKGNTTRHKESHHVAITAVQTDRPYPALSVRPEGFLGRAWGRLTNTDIQLEWEDFNRAFTVNCPDRRFASDVLTQQMMEMLMQERDLAWCIIGPDILTLRRGRHDPTELEVTMASLDQILDLVPEHVRQTDWNVQ
jgi:hypothetical protein